jgi:hypothetical protein
MQIQSLATFSKLLMVAGIILIIGAVITTVMGRKEMDYLGELGLVFCMMGIGFNITDKNISTISQEMNKKATDVIEKEG